MSGIPKLTGLNVAGRIEIDQNQKATSNEKMVDDARGHMLQRAPSYKTSDTASTTPRRKCSKEKKVGDKKLVEEEFRTLEEERNKLQFGVKGNFTTLRMIPETVPQYKLEYTFKSVSFTAGGVSALVNKFKFLGFRIISLSFKNCEFEEGAFGILKKWVVNNPDLSTLHFEETKFNSDIAKTIEEVLKEPTTPIKTLKFVNMKVSVSEFEKIVSGIVSQNESQAKCKVTSLAFQECELDYRYASSLYNLIANSKHLEHLDLQKNHLGAQSCLSQSLKGKIRNFPKLARTSSHSAYDQDKLSNRGKVIKQRPGSWSEKVSSPLESKEIIEKREISETKKENEAEKEESTPRHAVSISKVAQALRKNSNLKSFVLSSNGLILKDYNELYDVVNQEKDKDIIINVKGNSIQGQRESKKLITGTSPRDNALRRSPSPAPERHARIVETPEPKKDNNGGLEKSKSQTAVNQVPISISGKLQMFGMGLLNRSPQRLGVRPEELPKAQSTPYRKKNKK